MILRTRSRRSIQALPFGLVWSRLAPLAAQAAIDAEDSSKDAPGAEAVDWAILGNHLAVARLFTDKGARDNPFLTLGSMPFWLMDKAAGKP